MARTKEYDRQRVLAEAVSVFWHKGFEGTTITDIEKATGLNTNSMYKEFGNKEGLFKAAMESYYHSQLMAMVGRLKERPGLDAIREFLKAFPPLVASKDYTGCLFMNTLAEKNTVKKDAINRVAAFCRELSSLLENSICAAQKQGDVSRKKDPKVLANFLVCVIEGLTLYGRVETDETMIRQMLDAAMTAVEG